MREPNNINTSSEILKTYTDTCLKQVPIFIYLFCSQIFSRIYPAFLGYLLCPGMWSEQDSTAFQYATDTRGRSESTRPKPC